MLKRTTSLVISIHLLFMTMLLFTQNHPLAQRTHHIKVRTVQPAPSIKAQPVAARARTSATGQSKKPATPRPAKSPVSSSKKPSPTQSAKTTPPSPKKSTTPQPAKTSSSPSKKPVIVDKKNSTSPLPAKPQPLQDPLPDAPIWEEIDQALAKIEPKAYSKEDPALMVPKLSQFVSSSPLEVESVESQLVCFLHDTLSLPEVGEVKVELVVDKNGMVQKVIVLSSESEKNKQYLQTHLPRLKFPMQFEQDKTWTLTFSNEI